MTALILPLARRLAQRALVIVVCTVGTLAVAVRAAAADGAVTLVDPGGSNKVQRGGSATQFEIQVPLDAACPGDTMHDQWRLQSFLLPHNVDPGSITYQSQGPVGEGQYALYLLTTRPFVDQPTRSNSVAGKPGGIDPIGPLSFAVYQPVHLEGSYRLGVACTLSRQVAKYWETEIVVTPTPSDKPSGLVWVLASAPEAAEPRGSGYTAALVTAGVVLLALGFLVLSRKRTFTTTR